MFTDGEVITMLRNVGVDVNCGACMGIAFTGVTTNAHTCQQFGSGNQDASAERADATSRSAAKENTLTITVSDPDQAIQQAIPRDADEAKARAELTFQIMRWAEGSAIWRDVNTAIDALLSASRASLEEEIKRLKRDQKGDHEVIMLLHDVDLVAMRERAERAEAALQSRPILEESDEKFAFDNGSGMTEGMTVREMIAEIQRLGKRCEELWAVTAKPKSGASSEALCLCGDYQREHENGSGRCLTCAGLAHMQQFPICEQFRASQDWQPIALAEMTRLMQPQADGRYLEAPDAWNRLLDFLRNPPSIKETT